MGRQEKAKAKARERPQRLDAPPLRPPIGLTTGAEIVLAVRYDALTLYDLRNHWLWADSMSIDASLDHDTRRGLRERARYEIANNSYAMGVALAIANAVVGTGPRLQAFVDDRDLEKDVEWTFDDWAEEIHLAEKLRAMRFARFQDGSLRDFVNKFRS